MIAAIITLLAIQGIHQTFAFTTGGIPRAVVVVKTITQFASTTTTNDDELQLTRRDAFKMIVATTVAVTGSISPSQANADEGGGRMIEFTVNNLDGEEGKTGTFTVQTRPDWAPLGAERFETLASNSFFENCRIFRVLPGFVAQFGINGDPTIQSKWRSQSLKDDPVKVTNKRGTIVFATAGPNTRTTQIFVNLSDRNSFLDKQGFSPLGEVISGMDVVDRFYAGYGEGAPSGKGPNQGLIQAKGNSYLESSYPKLSYFSKVAFK